MSIELLRLHYYGILGRALADFCAAQLHLLQFTLGSILLGQAK